MPYILSDLAAEKQKKAYEKRQREIDADAKKSETAAKRAEKESTATKAEATQAETVGRDERAKQRAGAVDVVNRSLEIVGALREIVNGKFPEGVKLEAQKHLKEIVRASNAKEAPEGSLEPAFHFLVEQASKPRFMRTGAKKSLPSIGKARVQSIVDLIAARWKNAPTVVVADNINDSAVPEALQKADAEAKARGAEGVPAGVFYKGNTTAPAWAIIEQHHLNAWCESDECDGYDEHYIDDAWLDQES
jgi:hypothetical protein